MSINLKNWEKLLKCAMGECPATNKFHKEKGFGEVCKYEDDDFDGDELIDFVDQLLHQQAQLTRRETIQTIVMKLEDILYKMPVAGNGRRLIMSLESELLSLINKEDEKI